MEILTFYTSTHQGQSSMIKKKHSPNNSFHARFWSLGQIASSAKDRVDALYRQRKFVDAEAMAKEWLVEQPSNQ
jgi:hypothetical protein